MDTAQSMQKYVGKKATLAVELSLSVNVKILDAKARYGRVDVLVTPISGSGEKWVSSDRVTVQK